MHWFSFFCRSLALDLLGLLVQLSTLPCNAWPALANPQIIKCILPQDELDCILPGERGLDNREVLVLQHS